MNNAVSCIVWILTILIEFFCPAVLIGSNTDWSGEQDPAYVIYQKYRYAYDTYGYLFLHEDLHEEKKTEEELSYPVLAKLQDYDYLMKQFYSVHASTTAGRDLMNAQEFLQTDLGLLKDASKPQILIYHTHSQETYADYGPEQKDANVVTAGDYLTQLLIDKGWNVIHDDSAYDMQGGKLDRSKAYNYALEGITQILQEYPSIEVILDLHRDGVKENLHLVSEVNGKPTANLMFFQGMSRTPEGAIEYLPNPYLKENLAFSFQMQYQAAGKFPGLTRKIYLKGLRYNLHLRPRSALIEAGAQTNTLSEVLNAMEPLAELLDMVLQGK